MSWLPVDRPKSNAEVTVVMHRHAGSGGPLFTVGLSRDFISEVGWKKQDAFTILRGSGDDSGNIRLVRGGTPRLGRLMLHGGSGGAIRFGRVAFLGDEYHEKAVVDHHVIDQNTLEIHLPEYWRSSSAERKPVDAKPRPRPTVSIGGIKIVTAEDQECISFRGKTAELTHRQSQVLVQLAREMPLSVNRAALKKRAWGNQQPANADVLLGEIEIALEKLLPEVGLVLERMQSGVGLRVPS